MLIVLIAAAAVSGGGGAQIGFLSNEFSGTVRNDFEIVFFAWDFHIEWLACSLKLFYSTSSTNLSENSFRDISAQKIAKSCNFTPLRR